MAHPTTLLLGLGREVGPAVARAFFDDGHNVLVADSNPKRVERARAELPDKVLTIDADLSDDVDLHKCFALADESFGRLDHLVLIPTIPDEDSLADVVHEAFSATVGTHLGGLVRAIQDFSSRIADQETLAEARATQSRQRGSISIILSNAAISSQPGRFTATALQGAIHALVRATALELAGDRIRVNAVVALRPRVEEHQVESSWIEARTPLGRVALGDEIAAAALYLSSEGAAIITGETLVLDGGRRVLSGLV